MPANNKPCSVCSTLPPDVLDRANRLLLAGIAATEVRATLTLEGYELTTRQLQNHARHIKPEAKVEVVQTLVTDPDRPEDIPVTSYMAAEDIDRKEAITRVLMTALEQADRLRAICKDTLSLRTERLLSEHLFRTVQMIDKARQIEQEVKTAEDTALLPPLDEGKAQEVNFIVNIEALTDITP